MQIELPDDFAPLLGPDPATAVREAVLLQLVHEGRLTVAAAGERLGLGRLEAIRWYTGHGYPYPDMTPAELRQQVNALDNLLAR
jgi:hypothetical protein